MTVVRQTGIQKIDMFMRDASDFIKRVIQVRLSGVNKGTKPTLNFIAGSGITITVVDNPKTGAIDITIGT